MAQGAESIAHRAGGMAQGAERMEQRAKRMAHGEKSKASIGRFQCSVFGVQEPRTLLKIPKEAKTPEALVLLPCASHFARCFHYFC